MMATLCAVSSDFVPITSVSRTSVSDASVSSASVSSTSASDASISSTSRTQCLSRNNVGVATQSLSTGMCLHHL